MNLDELQRLAEGATPSPWKAYDAAVRACDEIHSLIAFGYMRNIEPAQRDAAYIAAMHPDTAKKLIAAARAALALLPILEEHLFERGPEEEALRNALEEFKCQ